MGGENFGGGMFRDVKIKTEARPVRNSAWRSSDAQKPNRISNASDESDETGVQLTL